MHADSHFCNCMDNAFWAGAPVTLQRCVFDDNVATHVTAVGSTGAALIVAWGTQVWAPKTVFTRSTGSDVLLLERSSKLYSSMPASSLKIAKSSKGRLLQEDARPDYSFLQGDDAELASIQQVRCTACYSLALIMRNAYKCVRDLCRRCKCASTVALLCQ